MFALIPTGYAQNIVPNYSFEQADSCPKGFNVNIAKYSLGCVGWGQATRATADYFNICDSIYSIVGIPKNFIGYQAAYDGNAYAGIYMHVANNTTYKEYLTRTIPALQKDTAYKVTIYVSLADSSKYATNGLGVLFTTYGSPNQNGNLELNKIPQINYTNYGAISDTSNWKRLTGVFVADSAYTNIIIGGFKPAGEMDIVLVNDSPSKTLPFNSYYYIDNIVVEKASSTDVHMVNTNNWITIYPNPFTYYATLTFRNHSMEEHTFELYNVQGQVVQVIGKIVTDRVRVERNDLPPGFYYYKLTNNNREVMTGKLMIQ